MDKKISRRLSLVESKARKIRAKGKRDVNAEINVTPLVDVVLVLLIIFMLVTPLLNSKIELPLAVDPINITEAQDNLGMSIDRDGVVTIAEKPVEKNKIVETLLLELRKNPFRSVILSADTSLQFVTIRSFLRQLREAGVSQAGLISKPRLKEIE